MFILFGLKEDNSTLWLRLNAQTCSTVQLYG